MIRYAHTNIISNDWKSLADFYIQVFNCKLLPPKRQQSGEWLSEGTGVNNASLEGVHLLLPGHGESGPTLEIYQYDKIVQQEAITPNHRGYGHLAFEVEDVSNMLDKMETYGGKAFGKITTKTIDGVGEITFVYARDPEGNLIELQSWNRYES